MSLLADWRWRRDIRADEHEVDGVVRAWTRACEGAGLVREVDTVTGPTIITPKITHIVLGPPRVLTVQLQPGMTVPDVKTLAPRLAPHLGAYGLRVEPRGLGAWCVVTLLDSDPLADVLPLDVTRNPCQVTENVDERDSGHLLLGRDEAGQDVTVDPLTMPHAIMQGTTRSGKSVMTYGLLAQLAHRRDVLITGIDPTGIVFRPFAGTRHADWQVSGLADLQALEKLLGRVVDEMDRRILELPAHRDTAELTDAQPAVLVLLEEWPGALKVLDSAKTRGDDPGGRVRALVSRLLCEGAKVGIKVLILVQRAEANVIGALERSQCSLRISFRVDSQDSVKLLHAGADPAVADTHTIAEPGIGLLTTPGRQLTRFRAPYIGEYEQYVAAVAGAA